MSLFHEIYKVLVRKAASAAERQPLTTKKGIIASIILFFLPAFFIVAFAIASFWIYISPLLYIVCAIGLGIIYFAVFIMAQISGQIRGAKYALQNPRDGETWIEITDEGESIWTSEKFIPAPALPEPLIIEPELELPEKRDTWQKWQAIYAKRSEIKSKKPTLTEAQRLERIKLDLQIKLSDKRLRTIVRAGEKGYLVSWEMFCKMTNRPLE